MTIDSKEEIHCRVVKELRQHLNNSGRGLTNILQIAVCGSSGKGIASDQSDFDVKVLLLHPQKCYLLQKVKESWHSTFSFEYNEEDETDNNVTTTTIEIDATFIDYLRMIKYISKSDMTAYEMFAGDVIYTTPEAKVLDELWKQAYLPAVLARQYTGLLNLYLRKPRKTDENQGSNGRSNKIAFEAVYLEHKLRFIEKHGTSEIPPFKAFELIQRSDTTSEEQQWAKDLLKARREQKNKDVDSKHIEKFGSFVRQPTLGNKIKIVWDADPKDRERLRQQLEDMFLDAITERQ
ncbi:unnamed protein product [Cylindrotheca closterium]|uniref:Uncharacterized protein n=1 Tax=Cylindrotheca closterium TaxID=2856 RepID=A0AAD2PUM9_9STRA|nr:unnamed protein product [Cylindrotheca closterium]